jgi:release factor glutamine methyltransferase
MEAAGADSPWLTALVLLEHSTGIGREQVLAHPERELTEAQLATLRALVERRCRREPLAYILGYREFFGRRFAVNPSVLIPRPETEGLIEIALERMDQWSARQPDRERQFLDVGTGSGTIAVTLLAERPTWRAMAVDIDPNALAVAAENAAAYGVADRLTLIRSDLTREIHQQFPLVAANLPYVPTVVIGELEPEVRDNEPRAALDGGPDGTTVIAALLAELTDLLEAGGSAVFELGEEEAETLRSRARELLPTTTVAIEKDAAGLDRYLVIDRPD